MKARIGLAILAIVIVFVVYAQSTRQRAVRGPGAAQPSSQPGNITLANRITQVAGGLEHPWGIAALPDGRFLVTERPGRLRIVGSDGRLSAPLGGVPRVMARGQGGLLDVVLDPDFATNRTIYLSYSEPGSGDTASTAVARAQLGANALENVRVIYSQKPKVESGGHYGSRLVFDRSGKLFITQGDRMNFREHVQDLSTGIGKVMRINPDGTVPQDNPFVGKSGALPEIWSVGHRNAQAAFLHPETGHLWTVEHGARGGDELNSPQKGRNYGWPVISYGREYSGLPIGEGIHMKAGMEQPVMYWDPVIAPSGMLIYSGDRYPAWKGSFFIGSLTPGALVRLEMKDGRVVKEERYGGTLDRRIRDVEQGIDGLIYVLTDEDDGKLLRIEPR